MKAALAFALRAVAQAKEFPLDLTSSLLTATGNSTAVTPQGQVVAGTFSQYTDITRVEGKCSGHFLMTQDLKLTMPNGFIFEMEFDISDVITNNVATKRTFKDKPTPTCTVAYAVWPCPTFSDWGIAAPSYIGTQACPAPFSGECDVFSMLPSSTLYFKADSPVLLRQTVGPTVTMDYSKFDVESDIPESTWTIPQAWGCAYSDMPMLNVEELAQVNELDISDHTHPLAQGASMLVEAEEASRSKQHPFVAEAPVEDANIDGPSRSGTGVLAASVLILPMAILGAVLARVRRQQRAGADEPLLAQDDA